MTIAVFGDTHGGAVGDSTKINSNEVWKLCGNSFPDFIIICGDFGYIFAPESNTREVNKEEYFFKWFEQKPWVTLFIRGNHDNPNRIKKLPTTKMFGADVGKVNDKLYHLRDGRVYTIDNKKFFVMGGAASIDKVYRTENINWWQDEIPAYQDVLLADSSLKEHNYKVDFVLSHTCPTYIRNKLYSSIFDFYDPTEKILEQIDNNITYSKWFFGHHHLDKDIKHCGKNYRCLYNDGFVI